MAVRIAKDDLFAGAVFVAIGAFFSLEALSYDLGTPFRMGPGFLPLVLGGVLAALGVAIAIKGVRNPVEDAHDGPAWKPLLLIGGAIGFFALTIRGLGFVPTVFVTVLATAFASQMTRPLGALVIATGLTVLSTLVFIIGLRLQVPMIGPWLRVLG